MEQVLDTVGELASVAREARREIARVKARHGNYDELAQAGQAFCDAFYAYQVAKVGKAKARKPNYKAVIR